MVYKVRNFQELRILSRMGNRLANAALKHNSHIGRYPICFDGSGNTWYSNPRPELLATALPVVDFSTYYNKVK